MDISTRSRPGASPASIDSLACIRHHSSQAWSEGLVGSETRPFGRVRKNPAPESAIKLSLETVLKRVAYTLPHVQPASAALSQHALRPARRARQLRACVDRCSSKTAGTPETVRRAPPHAPEPTHAPTQNRSARRHTHETMDGGLAETLVGAMLGGGGDGIRDMMNAATGVCKCVRMNPDGSTEEIDLDLSLIHI